MDFLHSGQKNIYSHLQPHLPHFLFSLPSLTNILSSFKAQYFQILALNHTPLEKAQISSTSFFHSSMIILLSAGGSFLGICREILTTFEPLMHFSNALHFTNSFLMITLSLAYSRLGFMHTN